MNPGNVLAVIGPRDELQSVKLTGFGPAGDGAVWASPRNPDVPIRAVSFLSPEALTGRPVDNRSDLYSLGCTAFHLLTGEPPFIGPRIDQLGEPTPSASQRDTRLPRDVDAVFERALAADPDRRYPSGGEFAAALRRATADPSAGIVSGARSPGRDHYTVLFRGTEVGR